ncbi:MAG: co-chaperone GroES [Actinomycetota bacterium]
MASSAKLKPVPKRKRRKAQVRLTGDRLIVSIPNDSERKSRGGLVIPATAAPAPRKCMWAEVALAGPDVRLVKKGDTVLFLPQAGLEVEIEGEDYLLLRERDVQAVSSQPGDDAPPGQYL